MKRSLFAAITVISVILQNTAGFSAFAENGENKDGYEYTIIDNKATITGYKGDPVYLDIPETVGGCHVTEIRDNAFYECGSLKHITLPNSVEKIGHHAFYACYSLESITIPDSVTELGMGCFCGCESLTAAVLPDTIERLPESCFRSCTSLKSIELPNDTSEIGDFCFSGCISLSSVSVGSSVTSIGDCSFYMCNSLSSIYIPPSVEEFGVCSVGYIPTESGASQLDGFTVLGTKNSAAKKYADENELSFENANDPVHAFAIQQISGRRINIPSAFLIIGAVLFGISLLFSIRNKKYSKK